MSKSYSKAKGRASTGRFSALPHRCLNHENFIRLSNKAVRLLVDLLYQYNGSNNGDLCIAWNILNKRGWKSKETIRLASLELMHFSWIQLTRQGGLNRIANLYAITFIPINECNGKLDVKSTNVASGTWNHSFQEWVKPANYIARETRRRKKTTVRKPYLISTVPSPLKAKNE